jgi:ATP-dependent Clp protease ATP-binding subunit ClpA
MFERFTDKARRVVVQAQHEARELRHTFIGTEHLLLGLMHQDDGLAVHVLRSLDVDPQAVAGQVRELAGQGHESVIVSDHIPFTPQAKKTLELALREAQRLQHNYIGTEHLLLGILRDGEGIAFQALDIHGVDLDTARHQVRKLLRERGRTVTARPVKLQVEGPAPEWESVFQLRRINRRLTAIEAKLGIEPSAADKLVRQLEAEIAMVRRDKLAAIEANDLPAAAGHRELERRLITQRNEARLAWLEEDGDEELPLL